MPCRSLLVTCALLLAAVPSAVASDLILLGKHEPGSRLVVSSGLQLSIDTSGLELEEGELVVLQVFSNYYATPVQPDRSRYTLNTATLKAYDAPPFKQLSPGDSAYLMVGREPSSGALTQGMFLPRFTWYLEVR